MDAHNPVPLGVTRYSTGPAAAAAAAAQRAPCSGEQLQPRSAAAGGGERSLPAAHRRWRWRRWKWRRWGGPERSGVGAPAAAADLWPRHMAPFPAWTFEEWRAVTAARRNKVLSVQVRKRSGGVEEVWR